MESSGLDGGRKQTTAYLSSPRTQLPGLRRPEQKELEKRYVWARKNVVMGIGDNKKEHIIPNVVGGLVQQRAAAAATNPTCIVCKSSKTPNKPQQNTNTQQHQKKKKKKNLHVLR